jgi:hypothetical protein
MKQKVSITLAISTAVAAVVVVVVAGAYFLQRPASKTDASTTNVHLTNYTDNDGVASTVVLSGAVGDFGQAVRSSSNDKQSILTLRLSHGTFQLNITDLTKRFAAAVCKAAFNQATCSGNVSITSSAPVVTHSGTGAYKGISGSFSLTMTLDEVVPKQPNCSADSQLLNQIIVSSGWGNVSL